MDSLAITFENLEELASKDIDEIIGNRKIYIKKTALLFNSTDKELARLSFFSQSFYRVARLLSYFEIDDDYDKAKKTISEKIAKIDFNKILKNRTFKVITKRNNSFANLNSQIISSIIGEEIIKNTKAKVKMKDYDVAVFAYLYGSTIYISLDFSGFDLSKRSYKIFSNQTSLNSSFAYLLFRLGTSSIGKKQKIALLDPFCGIATIPIEAALFSSSKFSLLHDKKEFLFNSIVSPNLDKRAPRLEIGIYAFDSLLHNIKSAKKNAKIANIDNMIEFSNVSLEWLDTRLGENSVDIISTLLPVPGKSRPIKDIQKQYNELFYQARYILSKDSAIIAATIKPEILEEAVPNGFKIEKRIETYQGKQKYNVFVIKNR